MLNQNNYTTALYRRNNQGKPCYWIINKAVAINDLNTKIINIQHGIVGHNTDTYYNVNPTQKSIDAEIKSKIEAKRKTGYKFLNEIKDDNILPNFDELLGFLNSYLPVERTTKDNYLLAMLAKSYDNTNNKLFSKGQEYIGQWKINGLRCFVSATKGTDIFHKYSLQFQSREGERWILPNLEEYLLSVIPEKFIIKMIEEDYILDGEVYIPNRPVNAINHAVKDRYCSDNLLLQYWCYDLAIDSTPQNIRNDIRLSWFERNVFDFTSKEQHLNNKERFVVLSDYNMSNDDDAIKLRDKFIDLGFEGLIMRNLNADYLFGSRSTKAMHKYKRSTDGKFTVIDIIPEGNKRPDIPVLVCKNDINDNTFECHLSETLDYQRIVLVEKHKHIGRTVFVEFGERSGVNQLPFHVKTVKFINDSKV